MSFSLSHYTSRAWVRMARDKAFLIIDTHSLFRHLMRLPPFHSYFLVSWEISGFSRYLFRYIAYYWRISFLHYADITGATMPAPIRGLIFQMATFMYHFSRRNSLTMPISPSIYWAFELVFPALLLARSMSPHRSKTHSDFPAKPHFSHVSSRNTIFSKLPSKHN